MRTFYKYVWERLANLLSDGFPGVADGRVNRWGFSTIFPHPSTLVLPETKFQIKVSQLDYREHYDIDRFGKKEIIFLDNIDMENLRVEFSLVDLLNTSPKEFISFCFHRLKESLDTIVWYKYKYLLSPYTKQEFNREEKEDRGPKYKLLDWRIGFPFSSGTFQTFEIEQKGKPNGKYMISLPLTPYTVTWIKV